MIQLRTGLPGAAKTYGVVYDLEKDLRGKKYVIFHNISGYNPNDQACIDWTIYIEKRGISPQEFFTKESQEALSEAVKEKYGEDYKILMIIDEAQTWFRSANQGFLDWLTYHRHFNQDIIMITQTSMNLNASFRRLAEWEIVARNTALLNWPLVFAYQKRSEGRSVGYQFKRKKQKIFKLYDSQKIGDGKRKFSIFIPAILAFGFVGFYVAFAVLPRHIGGGSATAEAKETPVEKVEKKKEIEENITQNRGNGGYNFGTQKEEMDPNFNTPLVSALFGLEGNETIIVKYQGRETPLDYVFPYKYLSRNHIGINVWNKKIKKEVFIAWK